jgi:hypothetical protein
MIQKLGNYLDGIVLGVRFRPNFILEDKSGEIIDSILYSENTFFGTEVFPEVETSFEGKILFNRKSDDSFKINHANVVLQIEFKEKSKFNRNNTAELLDKFQSQILNGILNIYNVEDIVRVGYVQKYTFKNKDLAENFVKRTVGNLDSVDDINLRFSKKIPLKNSLVKKDIYDYDNAIFNVIKKADSEEVSISLDYQSFFKPFLPDSSSIPYKQFLEKAHQFTFNQFSVWLNTYDKKAENEK